MKKIPTLFRREFEDHEVKRTLPEVIRGMDWVLRGEGYATVKMDGACCAIIGGEFYKRYDVKNGQTPPAGAIPCCPPDKVTGHHPHWVKVDPKNPADRWFVAAYKNSDCALIDGTYEAVGRHFQSNPYNMQDDMLEPHGCRIVSVERTYNGIKKYLTDHNIEGFVFWKDNEPRCKIKRSDFGLEWNPRAKQYREQRAKEKAQNGKRSS